MTFQAYIDTIKQKTGLDPADFIRLGQEKGFGPDTKPMEIVNWVAADYGLGRGHAMAIAHIFKEQHTGGRPRKQDRLEAIFAGAKSVWRDPVEKLLEALAPIGAIDLAPTDSYLSLLNGKAKFALLQPTTKRLDIGIKRKGVDPTGRFAAAGTWNSMVTHRVGIADPSEIDTEVIDWLMAAYKAAGK